MKITKIEDVEAWKKARLLTRLVYKAASKGVFAKDYGLRDQAQRASTSIMANIAEGFDSNSTTEFLQFLKYARRSATELLSHFYVALDQAYVSDEEFHEIHSFVQEVKNLIYGFIRYLKSKNALRSNPTSNFELRT